MACVISRRSCSSSVSWVVEKNSSDSVSDFDFGSVLCVSQGKSGQNQVRQSRSVNGCPVLDYKDAGRGRVERSLNYV